MPRTLQGKGRAAPGSYCPEYVSLPAVSLEHVFLLYSYLKAFPWICGTVGWTENNRTQIFLYFSFSKYEIRKKLLKSSTSAFPFKTCTNTCPFVHVCLVIACHILYEELFYQFKNHEAFMPPQRKLFFIRFYFKKHLMVYC